MIVDFRLGIASSSVMVNIFNRTRSKNESSQLRRLLEALEALRKGDLTIRLEKETEYIYGQLAYSYNQTVDQISTFASEVTRIATEVGIEGQLGGQADVPGVAGAWKNLSKIYWHGADPLQPNPNFAS